MYEKEKKIEAELKKIEAKLLRLKKEIAKTEERKDEIFSLFPNFKQVEGGTKFKILFDYSGAEYMALEKPIRLYHNCLPLRCYKTNGENKGRLLCELDEGRKVVILE